MDAAGAQAHILPAPALLPEFLLGGDTKRDLSPILASPTWVWDFELQKGSGIPLGPGTLVPVPGSLVTN